MKTNKIINIFGIYTDIVKNGGITYNTKTNESVFGAGYSVAMIGYETKIPADTFSPADLYNYIQKNEGILAQKDTHLGAWIDEGVVYLDLSIVVFDEDEAKTIAKNQGELGIFNLETFDTIYLEYESEQQRLLIRAIFEETVA